MEISLEKIELVKDRTGVSYKEAKDALEQTEGNVVDAIILIEDAIDDKTNTKFNKEKVEIFEKIKEAIKKGNVSKIQFTRDGEVLLNIPVNVGILGGVVFPWAAIAGTVAALAVKCNIEIIKDNGEVVDINEMTGGRFDDIRVKAGDAFEDIKIKAGDVYENVKYKVDEFKEKKMHDDDDSAYEGSGSCNCEDENCCKDSDDKNCCSTDDSKEN